MKKSITEFAVETDKNKVVKRIGKRCCITSKDTLLRKNVQNGLMMRRFQIRKNDSGCDGLAVGDPVLRTH